MRGNGTALASSGPGKAVVCGLQSNGAGLRLSGGGNGTLLNQSVVALS